VYKKDKTDFKTHEKSSPCHVVFVKLITSKAKKTMIKK